MQKHIFVLLGCLCMLFAPKETQAAENLPCEKVWIIPDTIPADSVQTVVPEAETVPDENFKKEKLIASVLAFPVPFGFTGLHRIYLGSEPWVPVAYLVTGGGGFGLLPLIDFIFIVTADEEEFRHYENNPKLFMFVK